MGKIIDVNREPQVGDIDPETGERIAFVMSDEGMIPPYSYDEYGKPIEFGRVIDATPS